MDDPVGRSSGYIKAIDCVSHLFSRYNEWWPIPCMVSDPVTNWSVTFSRCNNPLFHLHVIRVYIVWPILPMNKGCGTVWIKRTFKAFRRPAKCTSTLYIYIYIPYPRCWCCCCCGCVPIAANGIRHVTLFFIVYPPPQPASQTHLSDGNKHTLRERNKGHPSEFPVSSLQSIGVALAPSSQRAVSTHFYMH